jgi:hypothetical protein
MTGLSALIFQELKYPPQYLLSTLLLTHTRYQVYYQGTGEGASPPNMQTGWLISILMAESYTDLMTDPNHALFELSYEFITGLVLYPAIRWGHKRLSSKLHKELDAEHGVNHKEN